MKNNLDNFVSGLFSFFLTVNLVSQFTNNRVIMFLIAMVVSAIVVIDLGDNFFVNKAREFIFAVGFSTFIFTIGIAYYTFHSALPNSELAIYIALVRGHLAIQVYIIATVIATTLLQTCHSNRALQKKAKNVTYT